jgi:hypothetical protein
MTPAASSVGSAASVSVTGSLRTVEKGTGGWSWATQFTAEPGSLRFGRVLRARSTLATARDVIPSASDREAEMLVGERQIEAAVTEVIA